LPTLLLIQRHFELIGIVNWPFDCEEPEQTALLGSIDPLDSDLRQIGDPVGDCLLKLLQIKLEIGALRISNQLIAR
jgi:hypothetical protein